MSPGLQINTQRDFHIGRWIAALIACALLVGAGYYMYRWYTTGDAPPIPAPIFANADPSVDESTVSLKQINSYTVPASYPRYISIPSLDVDRARIMTMGLTATNMLNMPKNIVDTAWFNKSATPGSGIGAVVIDGHSTGATRDGVFAKLAGLKKDDKIVIERGDGKKFVYYAKTSTTMSLREASQTGLKLMMQSADPAREGLSLITNAGKWIPRDKVFDQRIVVRAVSEHETK